MAHQHTCLDPQQQGQDGICLACRAYVLNHVGTAHQVQSDLRWFRQSLATAPTSPYSWADNSRFGKQGGIAPPAQHPYPTTLDMPSIAANSSVSSQGASDQSFMPAQTTGWSLGRPAQKQPVGQSGKSGSMLNQSAQAPIVGRDDNTHRSSKEREEGSKRPRRRSKK
ncbi:hypothetical protein B0A50_05132 [Salinomyces thailandicus]|uniref:Uncharacterized protein n=1 Tax=Salinomyces thailandicus TaxID=706561 RepID=A0A4U0TVG4_9PEZI|nr:hypothetical protein B0A50_05132 [Salinomyces thailandica]